ncbi:phosphatidate cytidylyltransferase [Cytophaga aurantiaca]|uniref:phosphatidate cytidylyltransferase n=1 Tax=Cytophaga aurantiaca TaxID=29530 RepID=UPI00037A8143|nr:phosphatidate cytidylyltransferase [Cytophaga aurantiaca]
MSNLLQRIITGVIGAAFMLIAIWFSFYSFAAVFFLVTILSSYEYHQLLTKSGIPNNAPAGIAGSILVYTLFVLQALNFNLSPILIAAPCLLFMVYMLIELFSTNEQPLARVAYTIFGIMYVAVPFGLLTLIPWAPIADGCVRWGVPNHFYQFEIVFAILFLIWANDVGAYFVGKSLGKHKLFERISPKKTWEGSIGGLVTAMIFTYLLSYFYGIYSIPVWMGLCVIVVISGSLGDLVESMIKRTLNVKDSGTLLPGHGGFLDRFDALIFAIPFIYLYLSIVA